ncbi:hypothetical protein EB354_14215 [Chryseobacterium balustinum]|jgi:hypothetical protein|nr:hypothetical protein EB354_14215 [Chryseobacterium balustinum]
MFDSENHISEIILLLFVLTYTLVNCQNLDFCEFTYSHNLKLIVFVSNFKDKMSSFWENYIIDKYEQKKSEKFIYDFKLLYGFTKAE